MFDKTNSVPASASSSERRRALPRRPSARRVAGFALALALAGCATVRPEDKEYLAEPAMTWSRGGIAARHQAHVLDNREGSTGGAETQGGGCGCN
jgi:hypothetical protein